MIAAAVAPTSRVRTRSSAWTIRRATRMRIHALRKMRADIRLMLESNALRRRRPRASPAQKGGSGGSLKRLADAEMDAPAARLGRAVDEQPRDRIELVSNIESDRADRRLVPQARADRVPQIVEVHRPPARPYVARVEEC